MIDAKVIVGAEAAFAVFGKSRGPIRYGTNLIETARTDLQYLRICKDQGVTGFWNLLGEANAEECERLLRGLRLAKLHGKAQRRYPFSDRTKRLSKAIAENYRSVS